MCVYPNFSKITLSPDWKIREVALGFKPTAVFVVKLISAEDLAKKSGLRWFSVGRLIISELKEYMTLV